SAARNDCNPRRSACTPLFAVQIVIASSQPKPTHLTNRKRTLWKREIARGCLRQLKANISFNFVDWRGRLRPLILQGLLPRSNNLMKIAHEFDGMMQVASHHAARCKGTRSSAQPGRQVALIHPGEVPCPKATGSDASM